jgi:uncharacterized protein (TIGR02265 family)
MSRAVQMPWRSETPSVAAAPPWVVFEHTVEGLFRVALQGRLTAATEARLRRAGMDLSKKLLPAYSFETWKRCLEIVATDLYPHLPPSEAWRAIGRTIVDGVGRTVIGRATMAVARLLGPLRALRRLRHMLQSADNYVEASVTERSATCVEVSINEVMGHPTYYQGILEASLGMTGAQSIQVEVLSCEGSGATFRVAWKA